MLPPESLGIPADIHASIYAAEKEAHQVSSRREYHGAVAISPLPDADRPAAGA